VEIRHKIHEEPELAFEEYNTSRLVAETLEAHRIPVRTGIAKTGVLGLIKGAKPGKTVLLRADMDALALPELADVPYKSKKSGAMHACGHDGHTAALVIAALALNDMKDSLAGNIKLMFQPAEEADGGALPMIEEGILEDPKVDAAFGCHLWGSGKEGEILVKSGSLMASPDVFRIKIIGKGGHAAMPQLAIDPVLIAAQIIQGFQVLVSRRNNPFNPLVISTCSIHGGEAENIIPDTVELKGTIRTLDPQTRSRVHEEMVQLVNDIVRTWGAACEYRMIKRFPPLVNDEAAVELVRKAAAGIVGQDKVITAEATMGGEDFSYLAERVPSAFFFVGIAGDKPVLHHNSHFAWNDEALKLAASALSQTAVDFLSPDNPMNAA
jgi:amidohydrolase